MIYTSTPVQTCSACMHNTYTLYKQMGGRTVLLTWNISQQKYNGGLGWGEGEGRIQCPCTFSDCKGRQVINVCQHFFPFKVQSCVGVHVCVCVCLIIRLFCEACSRSLWPVVLEEFGWLWNWHRVLRQRVWMQNILIQGIWTQKVLT